MSDKKTPKPLKKGLSEKRSVRIIERILIVVFSVIGVSCVVFSLLLVFLYNAPPALNTPGQVQESSSEATITVPTPTPTTGIDTGPITITPMPSIVPAPEVSVTPAV